MRRILRSQKPVAGIENQGGVNKMQKIGSLPPCNGREQDRNYYYGPQKPPEKRNQPETVPACLHKERANRHRQQKGDRIANEHLHVAHVYQHQ